jgi:hypothetical protein
MDGGCSGRFSSLSLRSGRASAFRGDKVTMFLAQEIKMTATVAALQPVNLVYAEATGSFLVLLAIAQQQRFFEKHGVEIQATGARGATVPRLTNDIPVGFIGEPAAILQAADGNDVRIVALPPFLEHPCPDTSPDGRIFAARPISAANVSASGFSAQVYGSPQSSRWSSWVSARAATKSHSCRSAVRPKSCARSRKEPLTLHCSL